MNIEKYMEDYRRLRITAKDIFEDMGISRTTFNRRMKRAGLETNFKIQSRLNLGDKELETSLKDKYSGITKRCDGRKGRVKGESYKGLEYLPIDKWINFCMDNKEKIIAMKERQDKHQGDMRYSISIDRIDNDKGYFVDNLQFVTHGFNAWKRNVRPVKVTHSDEVSYFMSPKEAGRSYGIREQSLGDMLNGIYREVSKDFDIEDSDTETVLSKNNIKDTNEYYEVNYLQ